MLIEKLNRLRLTTAHRLHRLADRMQFDARFPFGNPNIELIRYRREVLFGHRFATILDIGANTGQSARWYRALFPRAMIYSFEPLPDCCARMAASMAGDSRFRAFEMALGEEFGVRTFLRSSFSPSSSFLPMSDLHKRIAPNSAVSESCEVRIERLDDVAEQLDLQSDVLVKIDVQGFEDAVLRGGERTIRKAKMLILEACFFELYHGQMLFFDLVKMLDAWGFKICDVHSEHRDPRTKNIVWANCTFVRAEN